MAARRPSLSALRQRSFTKSSSTHHTFSLDLGHVEPVNIPPIADIFDAPTRLGSVDINRLSSGRRSSTAPAVPTLGSTSSATPIEFPTSLPPPLLFEGPARPRSSFSSLLTSPPRRTRVVPAETRPSSRMHHTQTSISLPDSLMEMYEGPARPRSRYSHTKKNGDRTPLLAVTTAVATLAVGSTLFSSDEDSS